MRYLGGEDFEQTRLPQGFSPDGRDYVSALAIAPSDHDLWYAATFEGHLWYSRDHGATWTESVTTRDARPNNSINSSITSLLVSTDDPLTCFAGGSGYGDVPQHPPVSRRAHGQGAYTLDELWVTRFAYVPQREQPLKRVVLGRDEAVEARCRVVLGSHSLEIHLSVIQQLRRRPLGPVLP